MSLPVLVFELILFELDSIAILNNGLAGHEYPKHAVVSVVDSQLMAIQLESAVSAMIYKHGGFGHSCLDLAILQIFQEKYLCFL